ncbi:MAG: hypothetical protein WC838_05685 [Candidatus Margulisiibacteriota bacterium]
MLRSNLTRLINEEDASSFAEYAMIACFISLVLVAGYFSVGRKIGQYVTQVAQQVDPLGQNAQQGIVESSSEEGTSFRYSSAVSGNE